MKYPIKREGKYTVLSLNGEVDLNCSPDARKQILKYLNNNENLLIDMSDVEYIDSSGVASLVEGFQLSRSLKTEFALIGVSKPAMQVLQLAKLDKIFPVYDSLEDCL